jgi:hypothetical protein
MEAHTGDHVIVEGPKVGMAPRRGEVIEVVHGAEGDRLRVRWDGDDRETLLAPGTDLFVEPSDRTEPERTSVRVEVSITEDPDHCEAVARTRVRDREFAGWGRARRHPADPELPLVGEELAVARALSDVSHQLVGAAADTLESSLGRPVALHV